MSEITLALLIQDWLKLRGLKWRYNPERRELRMISSDLLDSSIDVEDTHIKYIAATFGERFVNAIVDDRDKIGILTAADPKFFQKLEVILRREERYAHFAKILEILVNAIDVVWGIPIGIFFDNFAELLDVMCDLWMRYKMRL